MVKVAVSWTLDLDVIQKLNEESKRSGYSSSFIANNKLKKMLKTQPSTQFYKCRLCDEMRATELDGMCKDCLAIKQEAAKKASEEEFSKIMEFQIDADEKTEAATNDELAMLNYRLRNQQKILKSFEDDKDYSKDIAGENRINEIIEEKKRIIEETKEQIKKVNQI